jgi:outer membrane receptor protein involved in Fe transport
MRATRVLPGVATNGSSRPYIRGSLLDDVLVQFDGVPLGDPFHLKDFQNLISAFDASAVDRIEVFSGGFPVRYGTRSGGVIDITPRALESGSEYSAGANLVAYNLAAVGHSDGFPVDWLATLRHSNEDKSLTALKGESGDPEFADSLGRVRFRAGDNAFLTVGWLLLDDKIQLTRDNRNEVASARYREEYGWLAYDRDFTERVHARTVLAATHLESVRSGNLNIDPIASGSLDESRDTYSVELRSHWNLELKPHLGLNYGLEVALAHADLEYDRTELFSAPIAASFARPIDNSLSFRTEPKSSSYALYSALRHRWSSIETELGLRLDVQDYQDFETRGQVSPRFNVRYDLSSRLRAYGSWGRFTQAQRIDELRVEEAQAATNRPELAVHAILGLAYEPSADTRFGLEVYRKRWSDVIPYYDNRLDRLSLLPDLQPDRVRVSPRDSESAGLELSARQALSPRFEVFGNYAWSRVADEFENEDVLRSWDQRHAASVGVGWNENRLNASALVGWHSGWPRTPLTMDANGWTLGGRNSDRWGQYFTVDLRAGLTVPWNRYEWLTWVEVTNSTNRDNECCVRFVSPASPASSALAPPSSWMPRIFNAGFSVRLRSAP